MRRLFLACVAVGLVATTTWLSRSSNEPAPEPTSPGALRAFGPVHPRLSPAGDRVVFSCQAALWVMPAAGGTMRRLTGGDGFDSEPAWSPDGQRIAYLNGREFGAGQVRLIRAEDGAPAAGPDGVQAAGKLAFHPDGRRLLASVRTADQPGGEALAWLDLATGKATAVTDPPRPVRRAALSGDGRWIAWATPRDVAGQQAGNDGPQADLWKVAAGGGRPEKVGVFPARVYDLCWSADGRSLVVSTDLGGAHNDLWQVPLDDPPRGRRLTSGQADEDRPSVSADGRRLLYTDNREGSTALVLRDLRDGGEQTLAVRGADFGRPAGTLRVLPRDRASGAAVPARVSVTDKGGKFYAPLSALYHVERGNGYFYCRDAAELQLPAGDYQVRVWRGVEYKPARRSVRIEAGTTVEASVDLERWVDAASLGLFSGENHIHANYGYGEWYNTPETMLLQCAGEDLNVCNFMVANSDGDGVFDRAFFRGRPDPLSGPRTVLYWNEEYRSTIWGHMTLVNLRQVVEPVFTGFKDTTNPDDVPTNADTADRTHRQGGLVNYTHIAFDTADLYQGAYSGKGLPVDAALGKVDSVDINLTYAGSVALWYRLLNCGFRLPASAGTDVFLNRLVGRLPGSDRAYVRIDGAFSYAGWVEGLRAGRSFVSNGPFVELSAGGQGPGGVVRRGDPGRIRVTARAWSELPMRRAELVQDGQVIATRDFPADGKQEVAWEQEVPVEHSGWIALRATGPAHADNPAGAAYAHTSPVYVEIDGRPAEARADAQFFLQWIDRLELALRERGRLPGPADRGHVTTQLEAARQVYAKIARP
jgi:dipeptidyl aminopeptidase/acylaminoacyl peptidase